MNLPDGTRQLTAQEIEDFEKTFQDALLDREKKDLLYSWLDVIFDRYGLSEEYEYRASLSRWYVFLTWRSLNALTQEQLLRTAVARQIPLAILLGFEVKEALLTYLVVRSIDEDDAKNLYAKMKKAFLESGAIIGRYKGKDLTVADLTKEITVLNSRGMDTIAEAELRGRLKQAIFPKDDEIFNKYIKANPDEAIESLINLIRFFLEIEPDIIWPFADKFINPERYAKPSKPSAPVIPSKQVFKPVPPPTPVMPTPAEIRRMIEKQFAPDDAEGIIGKLDELAEKYKNPKIAEMYYFDEKDGKFKWSV